MLAIVTKPFPGLPDGEMVVKNFVEGDEVGGELAKVAVREGWATPIGADGAPVAKAATETKAAPAKPPKASKGKAEKAGGSGEGEGEGL